MNVHIDFSTEDTKEHYFMVKDFIGGNLNDNIHLATLNRVYYKIRKKLPEGIEDFYVWMAGGCFVKMFSNEKPSDIDFFSHSRDELARFTRHLRKHGFKLYFANRNAIKGYILTEKNEKINIDIVKKIFEDEIETIENFDFSVTKIAVNPKTNRGFHYISAFTDLVQKRLVLPHIINHPIATLKRLQKYIKRGFIACDGTLITLTKSLQEIDLSNPDENTIEFYPDGTDSIPMWD